MEVLKKFLTIYNLMDPPDKRRMALILLVSMVNGVLSAASIAAVLPFIGLISDPDIMDVNSHILMFREISGVNSYGGLVLAFGGIAFLFLLLSSVIGAFDSWYGEIFGSRKDATLSTRLLENYLRSDALEFDRGRGGERAKQILADVERVVVGTLFSMLDLVSEIIISLCVVGLLLWVNWSVTLVVAGALLTAHLLINGVTARRLDRLGKRYAELESDLYDHVIEALRLQKEIKLGGLFPFFVNRYARSCDEMVRVSLKRSLISELPQYLLELIAFTVILAVAVYFAVFAEGGGRPVTIIGMYAVAAYRLIPSVANIFDRVEDIWYDTAILDNVAESLRPRPESNLVNDEGAAITNTIALRDISFDFGETSPFHLVALNLTFQANQFTCLKGRTGCGKSTVLNLVAGLYPPRSGSVMADDVPVDAYQSIGWQRRVGLVPSVVNVIRASLFENIALGVAAEQIDREKVRRVCRAVELDDVIEDLPSGYDTRYGEGGLSFSSGQIQKIGIARALYRDPELLLLDESTDAFDIDTERRVLDQLKAIKGMTIIFVSHRPSVMERADAVIDLEQAL